MPLAAVFSLLEFISTLFGLTPITSSSYYSLKTIGCVCLLLISNMALLMAKVVFYSYSGKASTISQQFLDITPSLFNFTGIIFFVFKSYKCTFLVLETLSQVTKYLMLAGASYQHKLRRGVFVTTIAPLLVIIVLSAFSLYLKADRCPGLVSIMYGLPTIQILLIDIWFVNLSIIIKEHFSFLNRQILSFDRRQNVKACSLQEKLKRCKSILDFRRTHNDLIKTLHIFCDGYGFPILTHIFDNIFSIMFIFHRVINYVSGSSSDPSNIFKALSRIFFLIWFTGKAFITVWSSAAVTCEVSIFCNF